MSTINIKSITMPAGDYFVGDPCYAVPDSRWMEWLEAADYMTNARYLVADIDGKSVLGIGTAYGDGVYAGSDGESYGVDAGLIGVVPVEVAEGAHLRLMTKVTFETSFECSYEDGTIILGDIEIDTSPTNDFLDDEEDEEEDDYGEEEDDDDD